MRYLVLTLAIFILSRIGYGQSFTITLESKDRVTDCVSGNGKLKATASPGSTGDYDFTWYDANGSVISSNRNANNLRGGSYTIVVRRKSDGLTQSQTYALDSDLPKLTVQVVQNLSNCASADGQLKATLTSLDGSGGTYSLKWYNGPSTGSPLLKTTSLSVGSFDIVSGLSSGSYTAVISSSSGSGSINCVSDPVTVTILDNRVYPTISITPVNNTGCTAAAYNGQLIGSVTGGPAGYSFEWFLGNNTLLANRISTATSVTGLNGAASPGQIYTLKVTNNTTSCASSTTALIVNNLTYPTVAASFVSHLTSCTSSNGSVTANVGGVTAGYTFNWSNGNSELAAPSYVGATYSSLSNGNYTVVAVNNSTQCKSSPVTVTVNDSRVTPTVPAVTTVNNTNCTGATANGSLSVTTPLAGYSYQWYQGAGVTTPLGAATSSISSLSAGTYRLVITNTTSLCTNFGDFIVIDAPVTVTVNGSMSISHSHCTIPNGAVTANVGGVTAV